MTCTRSVVMLPKGWSVILRDLSALLPRRRFMSCRPVRRVPLLTASIGALMLAVVVFPCRVLPAQRALTRDAAVSSAMTNGPRSALAAVDLRGAEAAVRAARQWENPILGAGYSKDAPQQHVTLDIPLDPWWIRSPRIAAVERDQDAARLRYLFATRSLAFEADTAYTRAQLTLARRALSTRSARDADSLLVLARVRRDAGDASELDVELATVFAGQVRNGASADSTAFQAAVLSLQVLMGPSADSSQIVPSDSLVVEASDLATSPMAGVGAARAFVSVTESSLPIGVAARDVLAAESRVLAERRRRYGSPLLSLGIDSKNPGGPGGALPLVGIALPLPIFNRNGAAVMSARAGLARAQAQLAVTRLETTAALIAARRDAESSRTRAQRSAALVASADRIAALSLLAYREGASTLLVVLEAQRAARESLGQYLDDVAASRVASSLLRLLMTPIPEPRL